MVNQYNPQRFRQRADGRKIGTIPIGTIAYLQDPRPWSYSRPVCRNPWIVTAWIPRDYFVPGFGTKRITGGHLAVVKSLRDGTEQTVADWMLLHCDDAGLTR